MHGLKAVFKKELADHFCSNRFIILFALIAMISLVTAYMVGLSIKQEMQAVAKIKFIFLMLFTAQGARFSLVQFIAFFGPLIGLLLGFDSINRERNEGTLSKLLAQPIFRDVVINGKFLAGLTVIAVMMSAIVLLITGMGLSMVGVVPGMEEIWRILIYLVISIVYIAFWLGVSILFSIVFRNVATSALAALAVWIFFSFFISIGISVLANAIMPDTAQSSPEAYLQKADMVKALSLASPMELYTDAAALIIDPTQRTTRAIIQMGAMEQLSLSRFSGPLALNQSVLIVMPHILSLIAITVICFAISYIVFMRQEIRSI